MRVSTAANTFGLALALALSAGCSNTTEPVALRVRVEPVRARYVPGETLTMRIVNDEAVTIGLSPPRLGV